MYPMLMEPSFKDYLWGGVRLKTDFGKKTALNPVAESWEISGHKGGVSRIINGEYAGRGLDEIVAVYPSMLGVCCSSPVLPVLVKLIDANQNLSLQVHPGDEYARRVEGESGKNEMWYVLDCEKGAELILGFKKPLDRNQFELKISDGTILDAVNRVTVQKGDCFCIPAGMLHAIGAGMLVAEVQQSSDITYRVYDYGRLDARGRARELHTGKAVEVADTSLMGIKSGFAAESHGGYTQRRLCDWPHFAAWLIEVRSVAVLKSGIESFAGVVCVEGGLDIRHAESVYPLKPGQSAFIPAGMGKYALSGCGKAIVVGI